MVGDRERGGVMRDSTMKKLVGLAEQIAREISGPSGLPIAVTSFKELYDHWNPTLGKRWSEMLKLWDVGEPDLKCADDFQWEKSLGQDRGRRDRFDATL